MRVLWVLPLLLAGCATTERVWVRQHATQREFDMDQGQCQAQAYASPGAIQTALVYNACMRGKGWVTVERPIR